MIPTRNQASSFRERVEELFLLAGTLGLEIYAAQTEAFVGDAEDKTGSYKHVVIYENEPYWGDSES